MPRSKKTYPCAFPGCPNQSDNFHHITYRPVSGKRLCNGCHKAITVCNINAAEACRRKLSNKHRWFIWSRWLRGEIEPVFTPGALRYLSTWRD